MQITRGKIARAQKIVVYGPEGIGKSTFASQFPNPMFIDTEGSTYHMDVARTPKPSSWTMLLEQVRYFKTNPQECSTLIIDTADWAEQLCMAEICSKSQKNGIEDFGYGKGYVYLAEEFGRLLNLLEDLIEVGINVVFTAHAQMRKFEQPDELGAYDRWEMKLQKKTGPLLKEWADMVLFANYKTYVVNTDGQGAAKGKNKAQGGKRIMHTTHHPCWDAKNRHNLAPELDLDFKSIAHCITLQNSKQPVQTQEQAPPQIQPSSPIEQEIKNKPLEEPPKDDRPKAEVLKEDIPEDIPKPLADLMKAKDVMIWEIQRAVASKGYYPLNTPIANYDASFVSGVLVGAWPQVFQMIQDLRKDKDHLPFN